MSLDVRCLAGELFHVERIRRRARAATALGIADKDGVAWAAHCAERVQAQNARIAALLAGSDDPHRLLADARALLA
jgi:hypothetical protein